MKSTKEIKNLNDIILPYKIVFPVTVEGGVNTNTFRFPKDIPVVLTYEVFEAINHSNFAQYLHK